MRAMRAWPVLLAVALAGCGGGTAAAPTVTAPEPPTTTTTAATSAATASTAQITTGQAPVTTAKRPELTFPATTPTEVLALAGQRPTGVADYQVTVTGSDAAGAGTSGDATTAGDTSGTDTTGTDAGAGVSYQVELASDDTRARIHQIQPDGQTWIGLDLASNAVTYTCTQPNGQAAVCRQGDDGGAGARAAQAISRVLGNAFVAQVFSPIAAQESGVFVAGDSQAGVPVSCMAAAAGRLCVSRSGFMTEISTAGVSALAQRVTTDVTTADLDPPQQQ